MSDGLSNHLQVLGPRPHLERVPSAVVRHPVAGPMLAGGVLIGGCVAMAAIDPAGGPTLCPFRAATGLWCPGCGSTRMLHQLATGHPMGALGFNPLAFVLLPFVIWGVFVALAGWFGGARLTVPRFSARTVWILAVVVMAFWILRNVPGAPFDALAPPP